MDGSFLQSERWERLAQALGRPTVRIESTLFIKLPLLFGLNYYYSPRPRLIPSLEKLAQELIDSVFVWIDPVGPISQDSAGFRTLKRSRSKQPPATLVLDLTNPTDQLLAQMKPKTRYNIRLSQRQGVVVRSSTRLEEVEIFWRLAGQTARRGRFNYHPRSYYHKMVECSGARLFIAQRKGQPLAAAISITDEDTFYYLHGASASQGKELMAPYLLQWSMIQEAKQQGFRYYDFWGIDQLRYPGVTRFKRGFNPAGRSVEYPSAILLPIRPFWFTIYQLLKSQSLK